MKENTFPGYGAVIKGYSQKAELTRADVAEMLGISRNTLVNWEFERSQPDMYYIRKICSLLHIPLTELIHSIPLKNRLSEMLLESVPFILRKKAIHFIKA